jgi:Tfp pilus assembly protein PilF
MRVSTFRPPQENSFHSVVPGGKQTLGDRVDSPRFIETVPRRGYRFIGKLLAEPSQRSGRRRGIMAALSLAAAAILAALLIGQYSRTAPAPERLQPQEPQARRNYQAGLYLLQQHESSQGRRALPFLRAVIREQPDFYPARVALAEALILHGGKGTRPQEIQTQLDAALRLAPHWVRLHTLRARYFLCHWRIEAAERAVDRALSLDPTDFEAGHFRARLDAVRGRFDRAIETVERLKERHPVDADLRASIAWFRLVAGDSAGAQRASARALEIDPRHLLSQKCMIAASQRLGDLDTARAQALDIVERQSGRAARRRLENLWPRQGIQAYYRWTFERLQKNPGTPAINLALAAARCGEKDTAFAHLRQALQEHSSVIPQLHLMVELDAIRDDPRYRSLIRQTGLPHLQAAVAHRSSGAQLVWNSCQETAS